MDDLQQGHKLLRKEVNHFKIYMDQIMKTLQVLLKGCNPPPIVTVEMVNLQGHWSPNQNQNQIKETLLPSA